MYNPKSNSSRPLRLSPEQSFQGTVFSNNDVSDQQYTDDYKASLAGEEPLEHPDFGSGHLQHPQRGLQKVRSSLRPHQDLY
ncbi:outer membrane lipoprotein-sorting protein [Marispirochaeta sp.]|uniref:outer membrane lipoprotein-sorting protein n=1 Tax=Marispirochaeta sp. TaxID=2038653 RepID=UPI00374A5566